MGVRISQTESSVVLKLGPFEALFALKGRLDIPRSHITSIETLDRVEVPATQGAWLRAPGTHVPGLIRYGSYGREPMREFWLVLRQRRVVVIHVDDWAYHRVILGSRDPGRLVHELRAT
ncbi:MAG: hypothetical protein OEQ47_12635 [Acidimicrobiia bacterium]|nr:hypothetical protein [Acidimicrobiia bacterium]